MYAPSLRRGFAAGADISVGQGEFHLVDHEIVGLDVGDIERRATVENLAAWNVCCAAWSIVSTRHTSQSSSDFVAINVSRQSPRNCWDLTDLIKVHASVNEDASFSDLLHHGLEVVNDDPYVLVTTSPTVVVYPSTFPVGPTGMDLDPRTKAEVVIQLSSRRPKTIQAICRYHSSLTRHYVETFVHHFLHLLRHITSHRSWRSLRVGDISMMSLQEELQLRHECLPGRGLDEMEVGSVHQLFRRQARKTPSRPALEGSGGNVFSYKELDLVSDLMAQKLRRRNLILGPLDTGITVDSAAVVGIMLQRSPHVVVAILSCWKAGLAVVLVDPGQPVSRNRHIIENCNCAVLLVDEAWDCSLGGDIAWNFDFSDLKDRLNTSADAFETARDSEINLSEHLFRPAWIRVTSGSTGRPKCALYSHASFGTCIASYAGRLRATKTLLFFNPISSASGNPIWSFLTNGGCVCIPTQEEMMSDLTACINRYGIDDLCITPSAISLTSPEKVPALKSVSLAGEAIPPSVGELWSKNVPLLIGYGATEMNSHSLPYHDEP